MLDSMDAVVQSAAVTADKLLYSYAIELVRSVAHERIKFYFVACCDIIMCFIQLVNSPIF